MEKFKDLLEAEEDIFKKLKKFGELKFYSYRNNGNTQGPEIIIEVGKERDEISISFDSTHASIFPKNNDYRRISKELGALLRNNKKYSYKEMLKLIKKYFSNNYDRIIRDIISNPGRPLSLELLTIMTKEGKQYFSKEAKALLKYNNLSDMLIYLLKNIDFKASGLYLESKDLDLRVGKSYGKQSIKIMDNSQSRDIINVIGSKLGWYEIQGGRTVEEISKATLDKVTDGLPLKLKKEYSEFLGYIPSEETKLKAAYDRKSGPDYSSHQYGSSIGGDSSNYR